MATTHKFRINPAFHRYPQEEALIGCLLGSFGEVEYQIVLSAARAHDHTLHPHFSVLRALYRLRATSSRIEAADAFMRPVFEGLGLVEEYRQMSAAVRHSLKIRNQFSHCNWADHAAGGLFFADLEDSAAALLDGSTTGATWMFHF